MIDEKELVGEYWDNLHSKWINEWEKYGFESQDAAIEEVGKSIEGFRRMFEKWKVLHKKLLNLISTGLMDITKSSDEDLILLLKNCVRYDEPEIGLLIETEINKRNETNHSFSRY